MRLWNKSKEQARCALCDMKMKPGTQADCAHFRDAKNCPLGELALPEHPVKTGAQLLEELAEPPIDMREIIAREPDQPWERRGDQGKPAFRVYAPAPDPYAELSRALNAAYRQASEGKGKERHNRTGTLAFERQPILEIGRMVGPGYLAGQAMKKLQEAMRLPKDRAIAECYGAIVYAAAMVLLLEEKQEQDQ